MIMSNRYRALAGILTGALLLSNVSFATFAESETDNNNPAQITEPVTVSEGENPITPENSLENEEPGSDAGNDVLNTGSENGTVSDEDSVENDEESGIGSNEEDPLTDADDEMPENLIEDPDAPGTEGALVSAAGADVGISNVTVKVIFDPNGLAFDVNSFPGSPATYNDTDGSYYIEGEYGTSVFDWDEPETTEEHTEFLYWSIDEDGSTDVEYDEEQNWFYLYDDDNDEYNIPAPRNDSNELVLYANWGESLKGEDARVIFNPGGKTFDPASVPAGSLSGSNGTIIIEGTIGNEDFDWEPYPSGDAFYEFSSWCTEPDGEGYVSYDGRRDWFVYDDEDSDNYGDLVELDNNGELTLYASWTFTCPSVFPNISAIEEIKPGQSKAIRVEKNQYKLFKFTPGYSAQYILESSSQTDPAMCGYDDSRNTFCEADDEKGDNSDFLIKMNLTGGKTYYFLIYFYDNTVASATISLSLGTHSHVYGNWSVTKPAAVGVAGTRSRTCTLCGSVETQSIPAIPAPQVQTPAPIVEPITIAVTPTLKKFKGDKKGKATISWKALKKTKKNKALFNQVKGIQVQYSTDPTFQSGVITKPVGKKKSKLVVKGLLKSTTYYARIRYTDEAGGYSNWSVVKSGKTKKK